MAFAPVEPYPPQSGAIVLTASAISAVDLCYLCQKIPDGSSHSTRTDPVNSSVVQGIEVDLDEKIEALEFKTYPPRDRWPPGAPTMAENPTPYPIVFVVLGYHGQQHGAALEVRRREGHRSPKRMAPHVAIRPGLSDDHDRLKGGT